MLTLCEIVLVFYGKGEIIMSSGKDKIVGINWYGVLGFVLAIFSAAIVWVIGSTIFSVG